jgi:hypothetical protein
MLSSDLMAGLWLEYYARNMFPSSSLGRIAGAGGVVGTAPEVLA